MSISDLIYKEIITNAMYKTRFYSYFGKDAVM